MQSAVGAAAIRRGMTGSRTGVVAPLVLHRPTLQSSPRAFRSLCGRWAPKSSSSSSSSACPSSRSFSSSSGGSGDGGDDGGGGEKEEHAPTFRPRRMSRYGLDRISTRAVRPRGPPDPNAIDTRRAGPILLGGDDDEYDYGEDDDDDDEEGGGGQDGKMLERLPAYGSLGLGGNANAKKHDPLADLDADLTEENIGIAAAEALRHTLRERERALSSELAYTDDVEEFLREDADWMTSAPGSTEDLVGRRRALMYVDDVDERRAFRAELAKLAEEERYRQLGLGEDDLPNDDDDPSELVGGAAGGSGGLGKRMGEEELEQEMVKDYDVKPHHPWSETVVRVDRVQKVQRGGTMVRYRCLIVGGNTRGAAGFGVGKANGPQEAAALASRLCRRNVHFVDRYLGSGITHDLVGKHNSCRVFLRAVPPGYGLRASNLVEEILTAFGITDCSAKSHGNRNIYNVVRATFKAIATHESLEDIARKRGKRLINLERARRLQSF